MSYGILSHLNNRRKNKDKYSKQYKEWYIKNKEKVKISQRKNDKIRHSLGYSVCSILKTHHEILKDDPERLSTEFIQSLIGVKCKKDA